MSRGDVLALVAVAVAVVALWGASTWHSARTLDVICARGLR